MLDKEKLVYLDLYSFEIRLDYFEKMLDNTSSAYSFYWLEAVLKLMIDKEQILFDDLVNHMICLAYDDVMVHHYHLGPKIQGKNTNTLEQIIHLLSRYLPDGCNYEEVLICIYQHDKSIKDYKKLLVLQTPYRLLSSFLVDVSGNSDVWNRQKRMIQTIQDYNSKYSLPYIVLDGKGLKKSILISQEWRSFLLNNYRTIMDWIESEKIIYLKKRSEV